MLGEILVYGNIGATPVYNLHKTKNFFSPKEKTADKIYVYQQPKRLVINLFFKVFQ